MKFPKSLNSVLNKTLESYGLQENVNRYQAITEWEQIVGSQIASVAVPERVSGTELIVRVESSVWKYELTMRSKEILEKIYAHTGSRDITSIRWR